MLRIQVLGLTRAWVGGEPVDLGPAGQRAVLGLLLLAGGQPVSRSALIHALWEDEPPDSAVNILQTRIKHLRRHLEPRRPARQPSELIPLAGDGYRLNAPPGSGEANAGNSLGEALAASGQVEQARAYHRSALALAVEIGDHHQRERAVRGLSSTGPPASSA